MPIKVLVVDDASFIRDMVKRTLRRLVPDVELTEAPDGQRAMALIKSKAPNLILSDWEMPQMSGEELLRWVREQESMAKVPFVMITSRGDRDHVVTAAKAGVSDYLSKPFTQDELSRKISKQLKRIGYTPQTSGPAGSGNRGTAFSSIDVLTGGQDKTVQAPTQNHAKAKPKAKSNPKSPNKGHNFKGQVILRLADSQCPCDLKELSLQAICLVLQRPETIPTVFDQASVDLISEDGQALARLNAYIHSVTATELKPQASQLRIIARFVDQDPAKLEVLSKLIA